MGGLVVAAEALAEEVEGVMRYLSDLGAMSLMYLRAVRRKVLTESLETVAVDLV